MTETIKFPCDNCICVPVCRHKHYSNLFADCTLLRNVFNADSHNLNGVLYVTIKIISVESTKFRHLLQDYLNPTTWEINEHGRFTITERHMLERANR